MLPVKTVDKEDLVRGYMASEYRKHGDVVLVLYNDHTPECVQALFKFLEPKGYGAFAFCDSEIIVVKYDIGPGVDEAMVFLNEHAPNVRAQVYVEGMLDEDILNWIRW